MQRRSASCFRDYTLDDVVLAPQEVCLPPSSSHPRCLQATAVCSGEGTQTRAAPVPALTIPDLLGDQALLSSSPYIAHAEVSAGDGRMQWGCSTRWRRRTQTIQCAAADPGQRAGLCSFLVALLSSKPLRTQQLPIVSLLAPHIVAACRRRPYAVVLFDEVEKAHADVFNVLLQILDDGRVTDSQGRVVSFKNTILIMTSNMGSQAILEGTAAGSSSEAVKETVMSMVRSHRSLCKSHLACLRGCLLACWLAGWLACWLACLPACLLARSLACLLGQAGRSPACPTCSGAASAAQGATAQQLTTGIAFTACCPSCTASCCAAGGRRGWGPALFGARAQACACMQVRQHFRPEFINRIDDFIVFDALQRSEIEKIARIQAKRVEERLAAKKIRMILEDSAVEFLSVRCSAEL